MSLEDAIAETQQVLGPIFSKPSLTEKYLSRPPFRFLHDIVTSTIRETGFPSNFFADEELDPSNFEDKGKKVAFLEKTIALVNICHGNAIDVRATKIVAGLEPVNTNGFLVAFGKASVDSTLDRQLAIKYCLDGKTHTEVSVPRLHKILPMIEHQRNNRETIDKDGTRPAESSPSTTKIIVEGQSKVNSDTNIRNINIRHLAYNFTPGEWKRHCNGDVLSTREMIENLTSKPRCNDKLLERPPFSFLYDLLSAISKTTSFGTTFFDEAGLGACKDKYSKLSFLEKVIGHVQRTLSVSIDVKPGQILAGLEVEKTRQFLQLFVIAATIGKRTGTPLLHEKENSEDSKGDAVGDGVQASKPQVAVVSQEKPTLIPSKTSAVEDSKLCDLESMGQEATQEEKSKLQSGPYEPLAISSAELNVIGESRVDVDQLREIIRTYPGDISATKKIMESIVIHPKVSEKLLDRPPFRFLHDFIIAVTKATGYGKGLFTEQELDSGKASSKEEKIEFLEKVICFVEKSLSTEIGIRAAKVVSGLECEKTRLFLQLLVLAASSANAKNEEKQEKEEDKKKRYDDQNSEKMGIEGGKTTIVMSNKSEILADASQRALQEKLDEEKKSTMNENMDTLQKKKHQEKDRTSALICQKLSTFEEFELEQRMRVQKPLDLTDSLSQRQELRVSGNMQVLSSRRGPPSTECRTTQRLESQYDSYMTTDKVEIFKEEVDSNLKEWKTHCSPFTSWDKSSDITQHSLKSLDTVCSDVGHSALVQDNKSEQLMSLTDLTSSIERYDNINHRLGLEISSGPSSELSLPLSINHAQNNLKNLLEALQSIDRSIGPLGRFLANYEENLRQMAEEKEFWVSEYLAQKENLTISRRASEESTTDAMKVVELEIKILSRNIAEIKVTVKRNQSRIRELINSFSNR